MSPEAIEIINITSSISGIILGPLGIVLAIIAFIQAAYYYGKSKETEAELKKQLAVMATQNDVIKDITKDMLSGTIRTISKIAQNQKGPAEGADIKTVLAALSELQKNQQAATASSPPQPATLQDGINGHGIPLVPDPMTKSSLQDEAISAFGQIFIYAGLANVYSQYILPPLSDFSVRQQSDPLLSQHIDVVNMTFNACNAAYQALVQIRQSMPDELARHVILPTLIQYENRFRQQVRDANNAMGNWETLKTAGQS